MKDRKALFVYGRPFSPLYSLIMRFREFMYRKRFLPVTRLDVPVISVGNLTLGGTGKTPVVQYLAGLLKEWGWSPAVISRGYGGSSKERINIVTSGDQPLLDASVAGDEPRFLAETLDDIPVITGAVRKYPAEKAVEMGCNILILDDGFQHLALDRTIDLVLFNTDTLAGNSRVFPGGDLREPVKALKRCDGFVMTGVNEKNRERANSFAGLLKDRFPGAPVFLAEYKSINLVQYQDDGNRAVLHAADVKDVSFFGFTGIAHPERFKQTLEDMGVETVFFKEYKDHYPYSQEDMLLLCRLAEEEGATALVTTEKDMVKLHGLKRSLPLYVVSMAAQFDVTFHDFLRNKLPEKS